MIFVSLATYRDNECVNTVLNVFEQAKYPDRIRVGIFQQHNITTDIECNDFKKVLNCDLNHNINYSYIYNNMNKNNPNYNKRNNKHVLCGRQWQIKLDRVDWTDGLGPTYGRYRSELFYNNEKYVLQMDSHTALAPEWDIILIDMFHRINNDYAVITTYPKPLRAASLWNYQAPPIKSDTYVSILNYMS